MTMLRTNRPGHPWLRLLCQKKDTEYIVDRPRTVCVWNNTLKQYVCRLLCGIITCERRNNYLLLSCWQSVYEVEEWGWRFIFMTNFLFPFPRSISYVLPPPPSIYSTCFLYPGTLTLVVIYIRGSIRRVQSQTALRYCIVYTGEATQTAHRSALENTSWILTAQYSEPVLVLVCSVGDDMLFCGLDYFIYLFNFLHFHARQTWFGWRIGPVAWKVIGWANCVQWMVNI